MMASVTLKNIFKKYPNDIAAVSDFSLEIKDGESIVLVGPSGCGKTTTLRMIAGLEEISEGEIYIDGKPANDLVPKDRDISFVFQNYALFPHMTVFENIAFGLELSGLPEDEVKAKVEEIGEILDVTHLFNRWPNALSGGQKQRVALGRAIIREPKIFLLDEPLSNLDARLRIAMRTELVRLNQKFKYTSIYVTHDYRDAMAIADRIVVMRDGMIEQIGTPEYLYFNPVNMFVAGFLGTPQMNFWNCKVTEYDGGIYITCCGVKLKLPDSNTGKTREYIGKEVIAGIRPENMYEDELNLAKFSNYVIEAKVEVAEFMASEIILHFKHENTNFSALVPTRYMAKPTAKAGDKIRIAINPEKIYLFDKETELSI